MLAVIRKLLNACLNNDTINSFLNEHLPCGKALSMNYVPKCQEACK